MPVAGVAALDIIVEAVVAIIFLVAATLIAYLISRFGNYIPVIGGWLADQATRILTYVITADAWVYDRVVGGISGLLNATYIILTWPFTRIYDTAVWLLYAIQWAKYVGIPRALNAAMQYTSQAWNSVASFALTLYYQALAAVANAWNSVAAFALQLYHQAQAEIANAWNSVASFALTLYNQAIAYVNGVWNAVAAFALQLYHQAELDIAQAWNAVAAYALSLYYQALAEINLTEAALKAMILDLTAQAERDAILAVDVAAAGALATIWPILITDVEGIAQVIPQELTDIGDAIAAIPRALPGDLTGALEGLGALALPLIKFLEDCGIPMCSNLHGLSDLFGGLNNLVVDAALLALFTEAATDPQAAADTINAIIGPVATAAADTTRSVIGI